MTYKRFLEAINEFFKQNTKAQAIHTECFNSKTNPILLVAELYVSKANDNEIWVTIPVESSSREIILSTQIKGKDWINEHSQP